MRANFPQTVFLGFALIAGSGLRTQAAAESAPAPVRIVSYNLYNFTALNQPQIKTPESRDMIVSVLGKLDADIAVLIELSGQDALDELAGLLKKAGTDYPFRSLVEPVPQPDRRKKDQEYLKIDREEHRDRHRPYMKNYMREYRKSRRPIKDAEAPKDNEAK